MSESCSSSSTCTSSSECDDEEFKFSDIDEPSHTTCTPPYSPITSSDSEYTSTEADTADDSSDMEVSQGICNSHVRCD